jgi:hypothetical protein
MNSRSLTTTRPEHDCQIASASLYSGKTLNGRSRVYFHFYLDSPLVIVLEMCRSAGVAANGSQRAKQISAKRRYISAPKGIATARRTPRSGATFRLRMHVLCDLAVPHVEERKQCQAAGFGPVDPP